MGEGNKEAPEGEVTEGRIEESEDAPGGGTEESNIDPENDGGFEVFTLHRQVVLLISTSNNNTSSNTTTSRNSNISIRTMDADLRHIVTVVCGINNT